MFLSIGRMAQSEATYGSTLAVVPVRNRYFLWRTNSYRVRGIENGVKSPEGSNRLRGIQNSALSGSATCFSSGSGRISEIWRYSLMTLLVNAVVFTLS